MKNLSYRKATREDAGQIARLFVDNADESYITASEVIWNRATPDGKWNPELFNIVATEIQESVEDANKLILVFFLNDDMVGYTFSAIKPFGAAEVEDFVLSKDNRGAGIGKAINEITADCLRQAGCSTLFMEVGTKNERMHRFVTKDGMLETSKRYWKPI